MVFFEKIETGKEYGGPGLTLGADWAAGWRVAVDSGPGAGGRAEPAEGPGAGERPVVPGVDRGLLSRAAREEPDGAGTRGAGGRDIVRAASENGLVSGAAWRLAKVAVGLSFH